MKLGGDAGIFQSQIIRSAAVDIPDIILRLHQEHRRGIGGN